MTEKTVWLRLSDGKEIMIPYGLVHYFGTLQAMGGYGERLVIPEHRIEAKYVHWIVDIYAIFDSAVEEEQLRMRYDATWCLEHLSRRPTLSELICVIKFLGFMDAPLMRGWLMRQLAQRYKEAIDEKPGVIDTQMSWEARQRLLHPLWRRLQGLWQALDESLQQELWHELNLGAIVACGASHSLFLTDDGLYTTGINSDHQLGYSMNGGTRLPLKTSVDHLEARQLVCGSFCSFVMTDEALLGAGGDEGQVGLGLAKDRVATFTAVPLPSQQIRGCASGEFHSFVWTERTLMAAGQNKHRQLGTTFYREKQSDRVIESPVALSDDLYMEPYTLWHFTPLNLPLADTEIIQCVVCSHHHTYVVIRRADQKTRLLVCGKNTTGELGTGSTDTVRFLTEVEGAPQCIAQIACGTDYCLLLTHSGQLYGAGNNHEGQLGLGDLESTHVFIRIPGVPADIAQICCGNSHTYILTRDGELWGAGVSILGKDFRKNKAKVVLSFTLIRAAPPNLMFIAAGYDYAIVVDNEGCFYGGGHNRHGRMGLGTVKYTPEFTALPLPVDTGTKRKITTADEAAMKKQRFHCAQCGIASTTALEDEQYPGHRYCSSECFQQRYHFSF